MGDTDTITLSRNESERTSGGDPCDWGLEAEGELSSSREWAYQHLLTEKPNFEAWQF